jgi:hypothetical protein
MLVLGNREEFRRSLKRTSAGSGKAACLFRVLPFLRDKGLRQHPLKKRMAAWGQGKGAKVEPTSTSQ